MCTRTANLQYSYLSMVSKLTVTMQDKDLGMTIDSLVKSSATN